MRLRGAGRRRSGPLETWPRLSQPISTMDVRVPAFPPPFRLFYTRPAGAPPHRFATFFCCLYDNSTRQLRYSSAGHNPALLIPANNNQPVWLKTRGNALGLTRKSTYEQADLIRHPGDRLVLYTDGVTEARNSAGDEFGEQRLLETVLTTPACAASALAGLLLTAITTFAATATQHDDITVITAISRSA
jgi:serine phosphatase RsbU (regulator of sigma subunit)